MSDADKIVSALQHYRDRTARQLCDPTGIWSGTMYPTLLRLEGSGVVESRWQDEGVEKPRRRVYRLKATESQTPARP